MRERTTWNDNIKQAAVNKTADPYTMNQDHPQPSADQYVIGDPSSFAEDVHPNNWDVEYGADGNTKRDEIGMPEKRPETYNHPEKTAADEEFLVKKADLCVKVARMMLAGQKFASEETLTAAVEDQAVALMNLGDKELIDTHNRMAQQQESDDEGDDEGDKQASEEPKVAQQQQEDAEGEEGSDDDQQKQASEARGFALKAAEALKSGDKEAAQAAINELVTKAASWQDTAQGQQDMQSMVQDMVQQAMQQQMPQQAMQQQMPQQAEQQMPQQAMDEDLMLDQMLAPEDDFVDEGDIQMDVSPMDTGDIVMAQEDEVLRSLFANDGEEEQQEDEGQQQQKQAGVRTASTVTVGTKPNGGVSRIGGNGAPAATDNKLDNLWKSAPDVRDAFGLK